MSRFTFSFTFSVPCVLVDSGRGVCACVCGDDCWVHTWAHAKFKYMNTTPNWWPNISRQSITRTHYKTTCTSDAQARHCVSIAVIRGKEINEVRLKSFKSIAIIFPESSNKHFAIFDLSEIKINICQAQTIDAALRRNTRKPLPKLTFISFQNVFRSVPATVRWKCVVSATHILLSEKRSWLDGACANEFRLRRHLFIHEKRIYVGEDNNLRSVCVCTPNWDCTAHIRCH